jgi:hypothetical protein
MLHPASLLLGWISAAISLQQLSLSGLALAALAVVPLALAMAPRRSAHMIRRSRWLLASLALLFAFGTPGRVIPGLSWLTIDGLQLAGEHLLRLVLLLLLLALLLERLQVDRLMSGLFLLLAPLELLGFDRQKAVARLMLVIDLVENDHGRHWRDWLKPGEEPPPPALTLRTAYVRGADYAVVLLLALGLAAGAAT